MILGLASEDYYSLKEVGAHIWKLLEQPRTVQEILESIVQKYAVESPRAQADLLAILQEMEGEGLIEVNS